MITISVILRTSDFRGDHNADVAIGHSIDECETVEHLVTRLLTHAGQAHYTDVIELRIIHPAA